MPPLAREFSIGGRNIVKGHVMSRAPGQNLETLAVHACILIKGNTFEGMIYAPVHFLRVVLQYLVQIYSIL